jgi:hypothetical protein
VNDRPTYPELLKLFYKHSFPDQLGAAGSSVAQAIIYKANELYFPSDFVMSNVELSHLSEYGDIAERRIAWHVEQAKKGRSQLKFAF